MPNMKIRMARPSDAPQFLEIYAPSILDSSISFELEVPSVADFALRMQNIQSKYPWLCMTNEDQIAGFVYASEHRTRAAYMWCVEISAYVNPRFRGTGTATTLYRKLFEILQKQGFYNAYAGITLPNTASVALHESVGMTLLGTYKNIGFKFGKWHDVGWWQISLNAYQPNPKPPLLIDQLNPSDDFLNRFDSKKLGIRVD